MSIKAGQFLFDANGGFVLDRVQTGGVTNVNIPLDRVFEVGNYQSVAVIRDIPDLTFDVESFDASTEIEEMLCAPTTYTDTGAGGATPATGTVFDFFNALPIDVVSPFRASFNNYAVIKGVAVPQLSLASVDYKFGVKTNSSEKYTFHGDSIYYIPGSPYIQKYTATGGQTVFTLTNTPIVYVEHGVNRYAYNVSVNGVRRFPITDYTETSGGVITFNTGLNNGDAVRITYGSTVATTAYGTTQATNPIDTTTMKPGAVRGKDVDVYVQVPGATPGMIRWNGVQTANVSRTVTLQNDEEFGNYHYVAQDYDTAIVKGDITLKPFDANDLMAKIDQISNVPSNQTAGLLVSQPLQVEVRVSDPTSGIVLKTLYIPDARFVPPAINGRVQNKMTTQFTFESDSGVLKVFSGTRPNGYV